MTCHLPRPLLLAAALRRSLPLRRFPLVPISRPSSTAATPATVADFLQWAPVAEVADVEVKGFVRSVRTLSRHAFVSISDGSSLKPLQAIVPADLAGGLTIGAAVRLQGTWTPSPKAGQSHELVVQRTDVVGPSDAKTFPLQKKYHTPEYLRSMPHLRARLPHNTSLLRFRSAVISSLSRFFDVRQFVQTHTPILTSSDCEGAGQVFTVSADASEPPSSSPDAAPKSFFRGSVYTTVSAQLHLEALAQALGNVWTLSPTFRAEQSETIRHLSEFYMLEAEMAFANDLTTVMDLVEAMLSHVGECLSASSVVRELQTRGPHSKEGDLAEPAEVELRWKGLLAHPWPRITYTDAIQCLVEADTTFTFAPTWGQPLQTEHEKHIATKYGGGHKPVFVTHYPRTIKAFYMKADERQWADNSHQTVECFDLLVPDLCEIAGGSVREHRLQQLLESMEGRGLGTGQGGGLEWYVDLRRWGCPPHGGFGLGFDRLLCYLSGVATIRDVTAFPRWYGRCDC